MTRTECFFKGLPVVITTMKCPVHKRKNKKRRIQKKWDKQVIVFDLQEFGDVVLNNGCLYMSEKTFLYLKDRGEIKG